MAVQEVPSTHHTERNSHWKQKLGIQIVALDQQSREKEKLLCHVNKNL
jgi:hypothetical protein